jgi:cytochrome b involved in lipid metabolism
MNEEERKQRVERLVSEECKLNGQWMIIHGYVIDVGKWKHEHPGGSTLLEELCGTDSTVPFENVGHSEFALEHLKEIAVGNIYDEVASDEYKSLVTTVVSNLVFSGISKTVSTASGIFSTLFSPLTTESD